MSSLETIDHHEASNSQAGAHPSTSLQPATAYIPLVKRIVARFARQVPSHVRVDDLMSAGMLGLLESMRRYDTGHNTSFETFAEFRIRGAIIDELRGRDLMARDARLAVKRIEAVMADVAQHSGDAPDETVVARRLGVSVDELRKQMAKLVPVNVFSLSDFGDAWTPHSGEPSPFEEAARSELRERLGAAISCLNTRQQQILHLYYRENLTMKSIGDVLGVTESRVCQLLSQITLQLKVALKPHAQEIRAHHG